jgi:S-DNA-T family DNA segregation ATPase FtsK/SpoIIIE
MTANAELSVTPAEKRWDFSRDAVTPGRLVAWGSELGVAAALVAPLATIPWQAGAGAGVLCTGAAVLYERARGSWRRVIVARASSWLATTGWLSYALAAGPTLLTMSFGGAIWATGAAVNIGMDRWGENTREAEKELDRRLEQGEQIQKAQAGWARLLEDLCGIEGAVADPVVDRWRSGAGYTVKVTLPAHLNVDALRGYEAALAGALHLPKGGGVSFNAGGPDVPRNVVFVAVTEKNMMSGAIPYPRLTPTTINKPVGFGVVGNGDEAGLNLKDEEFIAIGAQGSGKTALMKTLGLGLVRCVDAIVIDLDTSAKMSAVFVNPWLRHGIGVPLVDWPATTDDECRLAVRAAREAIAARKTQYADLLEDEDVDNLPARPDIPAIHIRVDETKSMPDDVLEGIDFIIEEGRSVNVRVSNTGLRATRDYITAAMDELTPGRIGLRTNNASELDMLYPGHGAPDMAIFTDPGTVVYMSATKGPFQPVPAKAYATMAEAFDEGSDEHARMSSLFMDAARQLSDIRPQMDEVTANAMGLAWSQRWARIIPNLRGDSYGNVTADRMHESVWELYQSWDTPASYDLLLGRATDDEGYALSVPSSGGAAEIPRLSETMLEDDELDRLAAQEAAIELARTAAKPKSNEALAVELVASMGRPVKPSEVFPLMVKAGYDKSDRTFRDLCAKLGLQDRLVRGHDGTYAAVECGEGSHAGRVPGTEDDADGGGDAPHERADLRLDEGGAQ